MVTQMSGEMVRALGGWASGGNTSDDYGSGFTPERLYGAIKVVRYDGLHLSHLFLSEELSRLRAGRGDRAAN
jgi:hypothetical protein